MGFFGFAILFLSSSAWSVSSLDLICSDHLRKQVYIVKIVPEDTFRKMDCADRLSEGKTDLVATIENPFEPENFPVLLSTREQGFSLKQTGPSSFRLKSSSLGLDIFCDISRLNGPIGIFTGSN